jgi:hypothetical protein
VTVSVDEPPDAIEVGFAEMLTVGTEAIDTVAVAVAFPPVPLAVAVYVVVAVGVTEMLPPEALRLYELPSFPATVTVVAFAALTVKVDAFPAAMEAGFAVMLTDGAAFTVTVADAAASPPAPLAVTV